METKIKAVRVTEIIMSGSSGVIGSIRYNELGEGTVVDEETGDLPMAKPLFHNFSHYPVVNEIVHIMAGPRDSYNFDASPQHYYLPPLNVNGSPHHNAIPDSFSDEELESQTETGLSDYFQEIENIRPLQPYLGDVMVEGRYGQSLRFGSTISGSHVPNNWSNEGEVGNPITIIRNGQTGHETGSSFEHILEEVNGDDSSIYLCSNQQITNFQKSGIYPKEHPMSYKHML